MVSRHGKGVLFREAQFFRQIWIWIIVLAVSMSTYYVAVQQVVFGIPMGNNPAPDNVLLVLGVVFGVIFPLFFYTMNLTTEVRGDGVYIRFFPFHRDFRRIPFKKIKKYSMRTYKPLREYGGWGIRRGSKGKAYNVSGNQGVQFVLRNGGKILIGSQNPAELLKAINLAKN